MSLCALTLSVSSALDSLNTFRAVRERRFKSLNSIDARPERRLHDSNETLVDQALGASAANVL